MKKVVIILITIAILTTGAYAETIPFETASLGRVVGDTPEELIEKLETKPIKLDSVKMITNEFLPTSRIGGVESTNVKTSQELREILEENHENTLLYLDLDGGVDIEGHYFELTEEGLLQITEHKLYSKDTPKIEESNTILANTPKSALYDPSEGIRYFPNEQTTTIIGSTSEFTSQRFPEHLICNLADGTIGENYQRARNKYYDDEQAYIKDELVGINLMSYQLLGNPNAPLEIKDDLNVCGKKSNAFTKAPTVLKTYPDGRQILEFRDTTGMISTKTVRFPLKTVVLGVTRTRTMNPKSVSEEEACTQEYSEGLTPNMQFTPEQEVLTVISNPYNCERNVTYMQTQYEITFISKQPFTAITLNLPGVTGPGEEINLSLLINSVNPTNFDGEIATELDGKEIDRKKESLDTPTSVQLRFKTPEEHGYHKLKIILTDSNGTELISSTNVFFVDNPPEEKALTMIEDGVELGLISGFPRQIPVEIPKAKEIIQASIEIESQERGKEKLEPFLIDGDMNVIVGESVFERHRGIYSHKYKEKVLYPQHPGLDYHMQNDGADLFNHELGECSVKTDTEDEKVISCFNGENRVEYTFSSTDQNSVLLKFFFEGNQAGDMIQVSQTGSWPTIKADNPEVNYLEEQTIERGETGVIIFQRGDRQDQVRIAYIFNPRETGRAVFSSYGATLQAFSNQGLGNGQIDLNRLKSGLRIVGYYEDEISIDEIKGKGSEKSIAAPITLMIGDQKLTIEKGGRVDLTEVFANYIEDNPTSNETYIVLGSEAEQNITLRDLQIIYS